MHFPPISVRVEGMLSETAEEQLLNELSPILVTPSGIVIAVTLEHPENAFASIVPTVVEIEIVLAPEQLLKAFAPIFVTPDGILIEDNLEHPENALSLIVFIFAEIDKDVALLQP